MSLSPESNPVHISGERQGIYANEELEVPSNRKQPTGARSLLKSWGQTGDLSRRWQIMEDNAYKATEVQLLVLYISLGLQFFLPPSSRSKESRDK